MDGLAFVPPMLPTLIAQPPEGHAWQHEIKYDGYRTEILVDHHQARAFTRNGHDWSERYRPIVEAARALACTSAILDGETIVQDEHGRSDFAALRSAITHQPRRLLFYAFDLLALDGRDLRTQPLAERRGALAELLDAGAGAGPLLFSQHVVGKGAAMFDAADAMGLEGIVSKKLTSRYRSGPSRNWLKIKCFGVAELTVVGIERGSGPPHALLAIELDGGLEYVGAAMVGLGGSERERFWREIDRLTTDRPPLQMKRIASRWVRPELRVRVRFLKGAAKLRHATVLGLVS